MAAQLLWHNLKHDQGFSCIEEVYQSTIEQTEDTFKYEIFDFQELPPLSSTAALFYTCSWRWINQFRCIILTDSPNIS